MQIELNTEPREGYFNRHVDPLPITPAVIWILHTDVDGETEFLCEWIPKQLLGAPINYVGCCRVITTKYRGIGFNAWATNNSEFIYWRPVQ